MITDLPKTLRTAYAEMMNSLAWKDLEAWALDERERSMKSVDSIAAKDLSINHVCEERGYRNGIKKLIDQAHYVKDRG